MTAPQPQLFPVTGVTTHSTAPGPLSRDAWEWFGHAGHLIVSQWCRFHLCTLVGAYLVSTVGEYWPERAVREIHAKIHDPAWLVEHAHLRGDDFDRVYMTRFGFEDVGYQRQYETMVFRAGAERCRRAECNCGLPTPTNWEELATAGYRTAGDATRGHVAMCERWAGRPAGTDA